MISQQWLITAAHCLSELVTDRILTVGQIFNVEEEMETTIVAKIGDHNRDKNDGPHEVTRVIEMAIIHPNYRRGYSEQGFDVALLKMNETVEFGKTNVISNIHTSVIVIHSAPTKFLAFNHEKYLNK